MPALLWSKNHFGPRSTPQSTRAERSDNAVVFFFHPPKSASSLTLPRQQWAFQREPSCLSTKHALRDQQVEVPNLFRWEVLFPNLAKIYIFSHIERSSLFYIFKPYVISKKQVIYTMGLKSFNKWYLFYLSLCFSSKKVDICFITFFFFFYFPFTGSQSLGLNFTLQNLWKLSGVLWQSWPALMWGYLSSFFILLGIWLLTCSL